LLQKVDNFHKFQFGTITSSDVIKGDSRVGDHLNFGLGFTETHARASTGHAAATTLSTLCISAQKEESSEKSGGEDQALREFAQATSFLRWQNSDIDLQTIKVTGC
jgi:hypothetical protein